MRRSLTVLAVTTALAVPALAAPVTQSREATVRLRLTERSGWTQVTLRLDDVGGARTLRVETQRCDRAGCAPGTDWSGPVTTAEVSATQASAHVRTRLDGVPLTVTWTPTGEQDLVLQSLYGSSNEHGETVSTFHGAPARVAVTLGSQRCATGGAVGDGIRVSDTTEAGAAPLGEFALPGGVLSCGGELVWPPSTTSAWPVT